jgi:nicotinamide-nucleotide adenylyltransferase
MVKGLFIARMQPFHNDHLKIIEQGIHDNDEFTICVGSSNKAYEPKNPFTLDERIEMIKSSVRGNYNIINQPDLSNDYEWKNQIVEKSGKFETLYTWNSELENLFPECNVRTFYKDANDRIEASTIRRELISNNDKARFLVPEPVWNILKDLNAGERLEKISKREKGSVGVYLGRFQPLHRGHLSVINDLQCENEKLIIVIGSADKKGSVINPFSADERKQMIERSVFGNYEIKLLDDVSAYSENEDMTIAQANLENNKLWVSNLKEAAGEFTAIYTGCSMTEELYCQNGLAGKVKRVEMKHCGDLEERLSATNIRNCAFSMVNAMDEDMKERFELKLKALLAKGSFDVLREIKGFERIKELYDRNLGYAGRI